MKKGRTTQAIIITDLRAGSTAGIFGDQRRQLPSGNYWSPDTTQDRSWGEWLAWWERINAEGHWDIILTGDILDPGTDPLNLRFAGLTDRIAIASYALRMAHSASWLRVWVPVEGEGMDRLALEIMQWCPVRRGDPGRVKLLKHISGWHHAGHPSTSPRATAWEVAEM